MSKSMTGFGKVEVETPARKIHIEIRSLNSKQADISLRLPGLYRELEPEIRSLLSKRLVRGKIDFSASYDELSGQKTEFFNKTLIREYHAEVINLAQELALDVPSDILNTLLRLPDVLKNEQKGLEEDEKEAFMDGVQKALDAMDTFREQEGEALLHDMLQRVDHIERALLLAEPFETARIEQIKERIRKNLLEVAEEAHLDKNRLEQELIYYLEKIDVTEEKVRLRNHCAYFRETAANSDAVGRKLGFIAQEMGREINTLGSKANDARIQQIVVGMKDELEKIKEQILNIL
ncbi:MAG: YicC/YloC family endoribonuclease [Bacteroidales bacterium]